MESGFSSHFQEENLFLEHCIEQKKISSRTGECVVNDNFHIYRKGKLLLHLPTVKLSKPFYLKKPLRLYYFCTLPINH